MRKRTINLLLALGVFGVVTSLSRPPELVEAARDQRRSDRVITRLVGQRQTITVTSTTHGVRYSVDVDGRTIIADASLEQLQRSQPEAFRQIQTSMANTSADPAWAGVDMIDAMDR